MHTYLKKHFKHISESSTHKKHKSYALHTYKKSCEQMKLNIIQVCLFITIPKRILYRHHKSKEAIEVP